MIQQITRAGGKEADARVILYVGVNADFVCIDRILAHFHSEIV